MFNRKKRGKRNVSVPRPAKVQLRLAIAKYGRNTWVKAGIAPGPHGQVKIRHSSGKTGYVDGDRAISKANKRAWSLQRF